MIHYFLSLAVFGRASGLVILSKRCRYPYGHFVKARGGGLFDISADGGVQKACQPIPPAIRETSAAQSPGCALSRVFSHAKPLARPRCNSRASTRFDFPPARRSISPRASDSGRFSSLQIGTALQC